MKRRHLLRLWWAGFVVLALAFGPSAQAMQLLAEGSAAATVSDPPAEGDCRGCGAEAPFLAQCAAGYCIGVPAILAEPRGVARSRPAAPRLRAQLPHDGLWPNPDPRPPRTAGPA